ncbi:hypothetical protein JW921_07095 [Candidatus Fermentibacterales bacterium]|nr:hypothetical protein [Candidatus Fermentibacterales bacterium]
MQEKTPDPVEIAWLEHSGRNRRLQNCASAGFAGEYPLASVIAVAEGRGGGWRSASLVVSHVRDMFAEGVAYGIGESLLEAMKEAGAELRAHKLRGCSATAAAFLGNEFWIAHAGNGRAYITGTDRVSPLTEDHTLDREMGLEEGDPGYRLRRLDLTRHMAQPEVDVQAIHGTLEKGQALALCTFSTWDRLKESRMRGFLLAPDAASDAAEQLLKESRARYRIGGGAVAVARVGRFGRPWKGLGRRTRRIIYAGAALAVILGGTCLISNLDGVGNNVAETHADTDSLPDPSAVFPLISPRLGADTTAVDSTATGPGTAASALPLSTVLLSESAPVLPESLAVFDLVQASPIDTLYENGEAGIYCLVDDSAHCDAALGAAAEALGLPGPCYVRRIIVVRDADAQAFASWLPLLDDGEAGRTAVIVETSRSVAGGRSWIRGFPVYANGDLGLCAFPSYYSGSNIDGIPASPDSSGEGYRAVLVIR